MKKFSFALIFLLTLIFSSSAYGDASVSISASEVFTTVSYDVSTDIYTVEPASFTSIKNALDFATAPNTYLSTAKGTNYIVEDETAYQNITINIGVNINDSSLGGEIALSSYSLQTVTINGGGFTVTTSQAREFLLDNSAIDFMLSSITFDGRSSAGGIDISAIKSATLKNVTFKNIQSSSANGGAVSISGGDSINFDRCVFSSNSASNGGAIYISGGNGVAFNGCSFSGNSSTVGGGAMYITTGVSGLTFGGTNTFSGNTAVTNGGAIYTSGITSANAIDFSGVSFSGTNSAVRGGCVYVGGYVNFVDSSSFSNGSADMGGALYISSGNVTISSDITFTGNKALDGGNIYVGAGTVNINAPLSEGTAANGGMIYVSGGTANINAEIKGDKATATADNGGALYSSGGTANIHAAISGNVASNAGGAIYINGGTVNILTSDDISGNSAIYGGAVYITGSGSNLVANVSYPVTFASNYAATGGGAIYIDSSASGTPLSFSSEVIFNGNYVTNGNGGALWLGLCSFLPSGTLTFNANQAQRTTTTDETLGNGGAVYVGETGTSTLTFDSSYNYTLTGNLAHVYGGVFYTLVSDIVLDGITITDKNTANVGGGFASSGSGSITVQNGSTISNQTANQGGAIFVNGVLTVTDSTFSDNTAVSDGGAVYGKPSSAKITNSFFDGNSTTGTGNGGALMLSSNTTVTQSTFTNNSSAGYGGSFYALGNLEIDLSYFANNSSAQDGGAIYFYQSSSHVYINTSTFYSNSVQGGKNGGALYVVTDLASISRCTFDNNVVSGTGYGGGVYLDTSSGLSRSSIENCTFTENKIMAAASGAGGGGGLAVKCLQFNIKSCTFTMNESSQNGGAIYVISGNKIALAGVLAVGNATGGTYDIYAAETNAFEEFGSGAFSGYNRIGVYGEDGKITNFAATYHNNTDVQDGSWTKETFFSENVLAVNAKSDSIPPVIGSSLTTQQRLLTIMLKEDSALATSSRATNIIPYQLRSNFPSIDERGTSRILSNMANLDVGAVFFDGTRDSGGDDDTDAYTISYVQISGVPNELRRVGQTVALIAKVYYTNGRNAYGGSGDGEEGVTWTSDKPSTVSINSATGVMKALKVTPNENYVTITVNTVRTDDNGNTYSASKRIKVVEDDEGNLNVSPGSKTEVASYMSDVVKYFTEYNMGYGYNSATSSAVASSSFQTAFSNTYGESAVLTSAAVSELNTFASQVYETSDNGYKASKPAALGVNYEITNEGSNLVPLIFPFDYSGEELKKLIGHNASGVKLDSAFAKELFNVIRIEFQGSSGSYAVLGEGSNVDIEEALSCGALKFEAIDGGKGVRIILEAAMADTDYNVSDGITDASADYKGPQIISNVLVVPDGLEDSSIYGKMWAAEKVSSSSSEEGSSSGSKATSTETSKQTQSNSSSDEGGGGGSCNASGLGISAAVLIFALKQRRKK